MVCYCSRKLLFRKKKCQHENCSSCYFKVYKPFIFIRTFSTPDFILRHSRKLVINNKKKREKNIERPKKKSRNTWTYIHRHVVFSYMITMIHNFCTLAFFLFNLAFNYRIKIYSISLQYGCMSINNIFESFCYLATLDNFK